MPISKPISGTIILHLKEGVNFENAVDDAGSLGVKAFVQLINTVKAQQGFICQCWSKIQTALFGVSVGHLKTIPDESTLTETPYLMFGVDWESFEKPAAFVNSEEYKTFVAGFSKVFDLKAAAPIMSKPTQIFSLICSDGASRIKPVYTQQDSDAAAAFKSPVTEVAFFELPNGASEEVKTAIDDVLKSIFQTVITIGGATGSNGGWSYEAKPQAAAVPPPDGGWLTGVFGYASIDVHMKWREPPECAMAGQIFESLAGRGIILQPAIVPGIDPSTGYFHVKFRAGT